MAEVQDVFRENIAEYQKNNILYPEQAKATSAILSCRTSAKEQWIGKQ